MAAGEPNDRVEEPLEAPSVPEALIGVVGSSISTFGAEVTPRLSGLGEPEDQMRGPLERLLGSVATALGLSADVWKFVRGQELAGG
jgi:hypothetical protein